MTTSPPNKLAQVKKIIFRDIFVYFCLEFLVAISALIGIAFYGYVSVNAVMNNQERSSALKAFDHHLEQLAHFTKVYSRGDDTYKNLVQQLDSTWAQQNIAMDLSENFDYELSAIVDEQYEPLLVFKNGKLIAEGWDELSQIIKSTQKQLFQDALVKTTARLDNDLYQIAVSPITPAHIPIVGSAKRYLVLADQLDEKTVTSIGQIAQLKDLKVITTDPPETDSKAAIELNQKRLGYITWSSPNAAKHVFGMILPPGLIAILLLILLGVMISRRIVRAANNYEKMLEELMVGAAKLTQAKSAAETSNEAKLKFLAMIGHEIRTPMNGIIGVLSLLKETPLNHQQNHYIDVMQQSTNILMSMVNDVLEFTKVRHDQTRLSLEESDISSLVQEIHQLFAPTAIQKQLKFEIRLPSRLPTKVLVDATHLRQVLRHLVGNALKFTNEGSVCIEVSYTPITANQHELSFHIIDTGIGVPKELRPILFNDFFQVDPSLSRPYDGPGLGLPLAKSLVSLMSGQIGIDAEIESGSVFWFTIPVEEVSQSVNYRNT